jgi:DNA polymerase-3 subunit epsilon
MSEQEIDPQIIEQIKRDPDYRLLTRLVLPERYHEDDWSLKEIGLVVDVETTGLNYRRDKILELGLIAFEYSPITGKIYRVVHRVDQFEDPGEPISAEITELTGITDAMVAEKHMDDKEIEDLAVNAALVIAHNAGFDRKFVEKRFPIFADKAWACSVTQIDWAKEGIRSRTLDYLAYSFGFFMDAHRAINDAMATLHILAQPLPVSGTPGLAALLRRATRQSFRLWAIDAPYEMKDELKARGYAWNDGSDGRPRSWYVVLDKDALEKEKALLSREVYGGEHQAVQVDTIDAMSRFSERE